MDYDPAHGWLGVGKLHEQSPALTNPGERALLFGTSPIGGRHFAEGLINSSTMQARQITKVVIQRRGANAHFGADSARRCSFSTVLAEQCHRRMEQFALDLPIALGRPLGLA